MTTGFLDVYLSILGHKTNKIMQVLAVIATLFIPLTLAAGIYGMNFDNLPGLRWRYGYQMLLLTMTTAGVLILAYFKRKKWL